MENRARKFLKERELSMLDVLMGAVSTLQQTRAIIYQIEKHNPALINDLIQRTCDYDPENIDSFLGAVALFNDMYEYFAEDEDPPKT